MLVLTLWLGFGLCTSVPVSLQGPAPGHSAPQTTPPTWISDPRTGGFEVPPAAEGPRTRVTATALDAEIEAEGRTWRVSLRTRGVGRGSSERALSPAPVRDGGERLIRSLPGIEEWYRPTKRGLEHGWTIAEKPYSTGEEPLWIYLEVTGDLGARILEDARTVWLLDNRAQMRMRYEGLRAWDASGAPVVAEFATNQNGFGVRVRDAAAIYPITIDPVLTGPVWFWDGDQDLAFFGYDVSTAGDVNGDGFSDVIVSAPGYSAGQSSEGRVFVFHGSAGGLQGPAAWTAESNSSYAYFGASVAPAGDVNGDGYGDVIIGASDFSTSGPNSREGRVYLYLGSAGGLQASPSWTYTGLQPSEGLGWAVCTAGDINKDGFDDVVVGAPWFGSSPTEQNEGRVLLFYGTATGILANTPNWSVESNTAQAVLGYSVSLAHDLNADGFDDMIVGAPGTGDSAWVFFGSSSGPLPLPTILVSSLPQVGAYFGYSVSTAGDVNGDGFADVVVGSLGHSFGVGLFEVFLGSPGGVASSSVYQLAGSGPGSSVGVSVGFAGDLNGDGLGDFAAGATPTLGGGGPGYVAVLFGSTGTLGTNNETLYGGPGNDAFGTSVYSAGDVNGDGFGDLVVGALFFTDDQQSEGRARVYYGGPKPVPTSAASTQLGDAQSAAGSSLALGDVDIDGFADLIVGEPEWSSGAGASGRVRLFRGSANGISNTASWTSAPLLNELGSKLGASVAFLGDVDDNGFGDVLVGAPGATDGQAGEGKVYLFRGSAAGLTTISQQFQFNEVGAALGFSVAAAGDVDGDGRSDAVVGAPTSPGGGGAGRAYVLTGNGAGPQWLTLRATLTGTQAGERFGHAVAGGCDLNADGFSDIAVGAPLYTNGQTQEGRFLVYRGVPIAGVLQVPDLIVEGEQTGAEQGFALSSAGDVNADGRSDLLVGAPGYLAATRGGFAFLHLGQSLTGQPVLAAARAGSITYDAGNARLGEAVCFAGDVNGDGFGDVLVGAPHQGADVGAALLFLGSGTGLLGVSALQPAAAPASFPADFYQSTSAATGDQAGKALAGAGDVLGHGFGDIVVGNPGAGSGSGEWGLYYGGSGTTASRYTGDMQRQINDLQALQLLGRSSETYGFGLAADASTFNSSIDSAPHSGTAAGRDEVRLTWEIQELGVPFLGTGLSAAPSWADSGIPVGAPLRLANPITGLTGDRNYHWRLRVDVRNPYVPHTRWLAITGNTMTEKKVGTARDCNGNGIGDDTEIALEPSRDCNGNGTLDSCDLANGTSQDCNTNMSPDECDLFLNDCNANLIPDDCEVDCNGNSIPDDCDITGGFSFDTNGDGRPDECTLLLMQVSFPCVGDGTNTPCPCGNASAPGSQEGCLNSLALGGRLRYEGIARVAFDNFVLRGDHMPNSSALYFQGNGAQGAGMGSVFGDGLRCASGSVIRLATKANSGAASRYPEAGDPPISVRGVIAAVGGQRTYQVWYRNAAAFCTISTFNLTNGVTVTWQP